MEIKCEYGVKDSKGNTGIIWSTALGRMIVVNDQFDISDNHLDVRSPEQIDLTEGEFYDTLLEILPRK